MVQSTFRQQTNCNVGFRVVKSGKSPILLRRSRRLSRHTLRDILPRRLFCFPLYSSTEEESKDRYMRAWNTHAKIRMWVEPRRAAILLPTPFVSIRVNPYVPVSSSCMNFLNVSLLFDSLFLPFHRRMTKLCRISQHDAPLEI